MMPKGVDAAIVSLFISYIALVFSAAVVGMNMMGSPIGLFAGGGAAAVVGMLAIIVIVQSLD